MCQQSTDMISKITSYVDTVAAASGFGTSEGLLDSCARREPPESPLSGMDEATYQREVLGIDETELTEEDAL